MNIKEHIDAGHYPKDEKGRALVPMRSCGIAVIFVTDADGPYSIIGRRPCAENPTGWTPNGKWNVHESYSQRDLLPPPPRKVEIEVHVENDGPGALIVKWATANAYRLPRNAVIKLTGSYEEEWK